MKVNINADVPVSPQEVTEAPVFRDWADRLDADWRGEVTINSADKRGNSEQIHMLQMSVARKGNPWPVTITLRSETVDVLAVITDGSEWWVVFVEQERDATSGRVFSNVAGGREWSEDPDEAACRELWEELGLDDASIKFDVDLARIIPEPVLASPGITNERVYMMRATIRVAPRDLQGFLEGLRGKKTGVTAEGEDLSLIVQPAGKARDFIASQTDPDAKTLLSLAYAGL